MDKRRQVARDSVMHPWWRNKLKKALNSTCLYLLQNNIRINLWHYRNAHDSSEVSHSSPISLLNCTFLSSDWLCRNQNFVERKTGDLKTAEEENQTLTNNKIKMMVFKYHPTAQRECENVDRCFVFSKKVLRSGKIQTFLFLPIYQSLEIMGNSTCHLFEVWIMDDWHGGGQESLMNRKC